MDMQTLMTLIITIIMMLLKQNSGGPTGPTTGLTDIPSFAQVQCAAPVWADQPSSIYVQGTMTKDCQVNIDLVTISGKPIMDRLNTLVQRQIEDSAVTGAFTEALAEDRAAAQHDDYVSEVYVPNGGQDAAVRGNVSLDSNLSDFLSTRFAATQLPRTGGGQYLKMLQTKTEITQTAGRANSYKVRFSTFSRVLRPWWASQTAFKPALLQQQKQNMDESAMATIRELLINL